MPLAGRRALELVRLSGNVIFVNYGNFAKPIFSVAGGRAYQSTYMLDGGNIQNLRIASAQVDIDPPVEVIQEFKVVQNGYAAEYGGSASGILMSTTKSGTNNFHGSAFEFFRNDELDAAGFFAPTEGTRKIKAPLRYNLFGGTLGGPIIHNRTHFFAGYEGTRRTDGSTQILTVPTDRERNGDFSQTVNSRRPHDPHLRPNHHARLGQHLHARSLPGQRHPGRQDRPRRERLSEVLAAAEPPGHRHRRPELQRQPRPGLHPQQRHLARRITPSATTTASTSASSITAIPTSTPASCPSRKPIPPTPSAPSFAGRPLT